MAKEEAWIFILVIMPVFSRWWGVRGMGSPSSFLPSSSSSSVGALFSRSSSFIPSSIHGSSVISSISSSCLVDSCESATFLSFSPILNPPPSFSPTPVYSTFHSASISSLSFSSNAFSLSLSSSTSSEDDHLIRRKRDFGYFKRYKEGMEECGRTGWGYWWEESCDNIAHCPDLKDEKLCNCDMMVPLEYICDGYLDCPDLTDELGCKGCNRDELSCVARDGEEQVCVRPWQLCDGVAQCVDGEDEAFCWRLESTPEDVKGYVTFRSSGYLQVKRGQEWRPVCLDSDHNPVPLVTHLCDLVVGDRYSKDVHKVEAVNKSGYVGTTKWARYKDMGVQVEVADSCEGGYVLEITCGEPGCFAGEDRMNTTDKQDQRVVGGGDALPFHWPFIVAILKNSVYSCGGTIVTSFAILTAAHCIDEGSASYYEIQAGMLRRNSWSPFEQSRKVSQILAHPSYNGLSNDVALFLLEAPLHLNRWVRPVCLSEALYPKMDQMCTVAGWGTLQEGGDTPKKLQEVDLPVLGTCLADTHLSDEQVLCAGYPEGKMDACQGDSGGPLMCANEENGVWEQVGVVSFGEGCARAGNAGVYARVTYFSTWIIKTAGGARGVSQSVEVSDNCSGLACQLMEGTCLLHASVCDGVVDCFKGEDEDNCLSDYEDCDDCSYYSDYNYDYDEKVKEDIARAASPASYYRPADVLQEKSFLLNYANAQFSAKVSDDENDLREEDEEEEEEEVEEKGGIEKGGVAEEEKGGVVKDSENEPPEESENEPLPRESQSPQGNGYHEQSQPQQFREKPLQPRANETVSFEPQPEPTENVPEEENVFPFLSEPESGENRTKEGGNSLPLPEPESGGNESEEEYYELMRMSKKPGRSIQGRLIDTTADISTSATTASTITTSITVTTDTIIDTTTVSTTTTREQNQCAPGSVTIRDVLRVWNETECSIEEYKCSRVPECVHGANLCDGTRHCTDGTDEMRCQCRDRMLGTGSSGMICDGHPDCPDASDEECDTCDGQFQCAISLQCVLASQVCDTHKDCRFGEDERECLLLYNKTQVKESVVKGILALREGPRWKSLCLGSIPERLANHVCRFLGYSELGGIDYTQAPIFTDPVSRVSTSYSATSNSFLAPPATPVLNRIFPKITSTMEAEERERAENGNKLLQDVLAVKGSDPDKRNPAELSLLKDVLSLRHFTKRGRTCRQAVLTCQVEACGKVPLYYFSKETPVWRVGGVPWAAGVYVDGVYRCGGTLVRPRWVATSTVCLAGISLRQEIVMVVMGSFRRLGTPTRIFGSHEKERRVDLLKTVKDSDILLLRLAHMMPKTDYINHLCLPKSAPSVGDLSQCTVAGESTHHGRESVGVPLTLTKECEAGNLCILPRDDFETCTESWAGILACQPSDQYNPTWQAVGVWTYRAPSQDGECRSALSHPRLTDDHLATMHAIFMDNEKTQKTLPEVSLMECDGRLCATGVCVTSQQECDARLDCPDLTDELSTCQFNVTTCLPEDVTVNVTAKFTMECKCLDGGWACRNGACLPTDRVCDGVMDCAQGEDEEDCSCCRVIALRAPERICDRTVDCDDGGDEKNCSCDAVEEFTCYKSEPQLCMERERVCDGKKDCQQGEDEGICVALAPNMTVLEDEFGRPKNRSPRGYLIVRLAGVWYTFIYSRWETYLSHLICLQLGYLFAKDTTFRNTTCVAIGKEWLEEERMVVVKEMMEDAVVDVVWIDCETDNKPMRHLIRRSVSHKSVLEGDGIDRLC